MILSQQESDRWRDANWKIIKTSSFQYTLRPNYIVRTFIMERTNKKVMHFIPKYKKDDELLALTT